MSLISRGLIMLVGLLHVWFGILEAFLWQSPIGLKTFGMSAEEAELTAVLAANQGLYNGFLAAGLFWSALAQKRDVGIFFLLCVIIAGIVGALTAKPTIILVQGLPALVALISVMLTKKD